MNARWIAALVTGGGLGLLYFGGLWLTVRHAVQGPKSAAWFALSSLTRLGAIALVLAALIRDGAALAVPALVGLWLARSFLIHYLGGSGHGL